MAKLTMDKLVALCKNRGYIFAGSEIYGGLANTWDYGPLGVEFKNNVKKAWWRKFVQESPYNTGLDCAILMNREVWVASGHVGGFNDPLMDCRACKARFRADKLIEDFTKGEETGDGWTNQELESFIAEHDIVCPVCGKKDFTGIRQFNLMFKTFQGVNEDSAAELYLRPETAQGAQGIFVNFQNAMRTTRKKLPAGIAQIGKSFRNEITPGNFIFRVREFEQMELEFFCKPGEDLEWFNYWRTFCKNWLLSLGIKEENLRLRDHEPEKLLPGHQGGEPAPARPRAGEAGLLLQGHHGLRVPVPLRLGRAVGHRRPHRLRPDPAPGALRQEHGVPGPHHEREVHPLLRGALPGRRPRGAGLPVQRL